MLTQQTIIEQTRKWIKDVVIGCNFCPFAAGVFKQQFIHFEIVFEVHHDEILKALVGEIERLNNKEDIKTTLLILPYANPDFADYLDLLEKAENILLKKGCEGIYQLASFHPKYVFEGSDSEDAANYTNRSPYAMLHLLREDGVEKALKQYSDPEKIPESNIAFAQKKGLAFMQLLLANCYEI